jgi:hypothetical protein
VEAVDPLGTSLWSIESEQLQALTQTYGGNGRMLSPGGTAAVFMDVNLGAADKLPAVVAARITATRQIAGADGKPAPMPADAPVPSTYTFTGGSIAIGKPAVLVEAPLRGPGWVAANGCCDTITSHRGAVMAINGRLRVPERFAIDWMQLDKSDLIFTGDGSKLSDYAYYGAPIYSAADGVVVNTYDGAQEQVPNAPAKGIDTENIGGNMVVVDIGGGAFALYAHMQKGSLRVKLGDRVKSGDVLGLLGNTGNSTAPHLHFHIMDGPSPLDANGLPFAFKRFSSQGVLAPGAEDALEKGHAAKIDPRWVGEHREQLPLNDEVVSFE